MQAEVGNSGGYSWVRIFVAGVQRYAAVLADRCQLVTLSPGDAFAACVAQGGAGGGTEELKAQLEAANSRANAEAHRAEEADKRANAAEQRADASDKNSWILRRMLQASNIGCVLSCFFCVCFFIKEDDAFMQAFSECRQRVRKRCMLPSFAPVNSCF